MKKIKQSIVGSSERFLKNIESLLPEGVTAFHIKSFDMAKASGYGSYYYLMEVEINEKSVTLKKHTHDSMDFDYYTDLEYGTHKLNNFIKSKVLSMLSDIGIHDQLFEIINN